MRDNRLVEQTIATVIRFSHPVVTGRLTFTALWANSADDKLMIFFLFFTIKQVLTFVCKLSPMETICMKCQTLFSGKIRKIFQTVVC